MPLTLLEQLDIFTNSMSQGDIGLMARALREPALISPVESKTMAERLGLSNGFVSWVANVATDPTVWIAALLARKYPPWLWSRGISKRHIGMATEFTGVSKLVRPVSTFFRGHGVEEMVALGMHRQSHIMRLAQPLSESLAALTPEEKVAVIRFREEGVTAGLTENAKNVSSALTRFFEDAWSMLSRVSDVQGGVSMPGRPGVITWGAFRERVNGKLVERPRLPLSFRNLIPHIPLLQTSPEGTLTLSGAEALTRMARRGGKLLRQALEADGLPLRQGTVALEDGTRRTVVTQLGPWRLTPGDVIESSLAEWQAAMRGETGKFFFGHLENRSRDIPLFSHQGQHSFVLDLDQIFSEYVRGASRTYAWNAPLSQTERALGSHMIENPNPVVRVGKLFADSHIPKQLTEEPLIVQIMKAGLESMGVEATPFVVKGTELWHAPVRGLRFNMADSPLRVQSLEHLLRSIKGDLREEEVLFGNAFSSIASHADRFLKRTNPGLAGRLATHIEYMKSRAGNRMINNTIATWSYYSTLGLNFGSAFGNSLQTPLTTLPAVGLGNTLGGISDFAGKLPAYASAVARQFREAPSIRSLPEYGRRAWRETFPDLAEFRIEIDPRVFDIDERHLSDIHTKAGRAFKNTDRYLGWVMTPFRAVEIANRAIAFYAGRRAGYQVAKINPHFIPRELLGPNGELTSAVDEYMSLHAARTVNATQFLPGGGTRTIAQDMVAPWLRTLTSFPIRFLSHMGESTVKGSMIEKERMIGNGLSSMFGDRNWGPLSRMYLYGQILKSGFRDILDIDVNRWVGFGPLEQTESLIGPIPLPPAAGLAVNTAKAIANREWDRTQPVRVPGLGELPIPKLLVPGGIAMTRLARAIDQFEPDLGGFVDEDGRLMRRSDSIDQIFAMLGIPSHKGRRERIQMAQLKVRGAKIREYRRRFAMSMVNGDLQQAAKIRAEYGEVFPNMPSLDIDEDDLRTYYEESRTPRLARMMQTLGAQRPVLEMELIDLDPAMIAPPDLLEGVEP